MNLSLNIWELKGIQTMKKDKNAGPISDITRRHQRNKTGQHNKMIRSFKFK